MNKNISVGLAFVVAGITIYQFLKKSKGEEQQEEVFGTGGLFGGSGSDYVVRDNGASVPTSKKVSFAGVPDIVVQDAQKLSNTYSRSGSKKKVSFSYDTGSQKNIISVNNKAVGEYDYKNKVSKDYSINTKKNTQSSSNKLYTPAPKKKDEEKSGTIGGVKIW